MRAQHITFAGYATGETDFNDRYLAVDDSTRSSLNDMLQNVLRAIWADTLSQPYMAVTVVGHSDRQDAPGMSHQQAQASESAVAQARAASCIQWITDYVTASAGEENANWRQSSAKVCLEGVNGAAGSLVHENPASEDERLENRRVVIVFSRFEII